MLLSASPGGRRGLQALCRLACSGIDAAVSASASSRLPPGSSVRAEEQRWSHSGAASTPAPFSSWLGVTTQTAHERSGGAHARSAACSRGVWWLLEPSPPSVCSPPGAAAGAARGAKTQAAQQRGGSKQQQLRQRRAPADDYPPVDQKGVVSVLSTKNNTIITLADEAGNVKAWYVGTSSLASPRQRRAEPKSCALDAGSHEQVKASCACTDPNLSKRPQHWRFPVAACADALLP
jgi:hypothetical protein